MNITTQHWLTLRSELDAELRTARAHASRYSACSAKLPMFIKWHAHGDAMQVAINAMHRIERKAEADAAATTIEGPVQPCS